MTVDFSLLGEIEARVNGQRLEIGHARQRCVLAAFLIDVNRPISVDQLIDRVWSDKPPHNARNSLAGYVSRLRNLLADTNDAAIAREPGAYVLNTDPLSVDLHRFRSLVASARASADPQEAARLYDQALAIWSGEPFVSLDTPWINHVREALKAELFAVQLDRNDAALHSGRHAELLVELTAAQAANPLDERLAGQLMLAQFRNGRQADALHTYLRVRERLVEELGVDPGSALRELHQQILTGEAEQPTAPGTTRPAAESHHLPPPPHSPVFDRPHPALLRRTNIFVGHQHELRRVIDALDRAPLVTLTGVGGVGKTRLALEVARNEQKRFGDGVWICELAPLEHGDAVVHTVAASVWLRQQPGMDIEASVIEYLREREVLLVFDNCEHVLEAAARLIDRIVRHCPRVSVLATSRQPLGIDGERIIGVPPLQEEDATRLFVERARASQPDFALEDQPMAAVIEICRRVDRLPPGVELAAARMRVISGPLHSKP